MRPPGPRRREPQPPHPDLHRAVATPAGCLVRLTPYCAPCPWLGLRVPRSSGRYWVPVQPCAAEWLHPLATWPSLRPAVFSFPAARCSCQPWCVRLTSRCGVVTTASGSARFAAAAPCRARPAVPPSRRPGALKNWAGSWVQLAPAGRGFTVRSIRVRRFCASLGTYLPGGAIAAFFRRRLGRIYPA